MERKYPLNDFEDFFTGKDPEGQMIICGVLLPFFTAVIFDKDGNYLRIERKRIDKIKNGDGFIYREEDDIRNYGIEDFIQDLNLNQEKIYIKKFFLDEEYIGIEDVPYHLNEEVIGANSNLSEIEEDMKDWIDGGCFVFNWGNDYYIDSEGLVDSS